MFFPTKKRILYEYPLIKGGTVFHKTDFVVELTSGRYILVELENPKYPIFTAKGDFSQTTNHAENQVRDWMIWMQLNPEELKTDLPGLLTPEGMIVIGRSADLSKELRGKITMRNKTNSIRLVTYDDLAEEIENYINHLQDV